MSQLKCLRTLVAPGAVPVRAALCETIHAKKRRDFFAERKGNSVRCVAVERPHSGPKRAFNKRFGTLSYSSDMIGRSCTVEDLHSDTPTIACAGALGLNFF